MKINEKNLCMFAASPPVDLEGYLQKRGEVNRSWQRRHFVLKGNLLFYFEKRGDREPLGLIVIEGCTIELSEDGEPYCFQIVFHGINNRTYFLSAESQTQMEQWMKALTCAGYEYMKLMVSELQRQLDELEGNVSSGAANGCATMLMSPSASAMLADPNAPRPPPRRQNPFNRTAPPPPPSALVHAPPHHHPNGGASTPMPPSRNKAFPNGGGDTMMVTRPAPSAPHPSHLPVNGNNVAQHLNGGLVLSPIQLLLSETPSSNTTNGVSPSVMGNNKLVTFAAMHAHFGRAIRNDLRAFWEQQAPPLVQF